jgi:hypothetical protein
MKRWITPVGLLAIVGCVQPTTTSTAEQAVTNCAPSGNFKNATLPYMGQWQGYTPAAQQGQLYLDFADPAVKGQHLAFLVDPGNGVVVWAAKVNDTNLVAYRQSIPGDTGRIGDCCRPPPPPPGGTDWYAPFVLEFGEGFQSLDAAAQAGAGP